MPQVLVIMDRDLASKYTGDPGRSNLKVIGTGMMGITERVLGIEGENDVAFTAIAALATIGDADFQVEVRFTAGEREYGRDEIFDPSEEVLIRLRDELIAYCTETLKRVAKSVSVWVMPQYKTSFRYAWILKEN